MPDAEQEQKDDQEERCARSQSKIKIIFGSSFTSVWFGQTRQTSCRSRSNAIGSG